jgi:TonB-linked SusC/RagA family outer membrane protein
MTKKIINDIKNVKLEKLIRIMKLSNFFLIMGICIASASGGYSQEMLLSLDMNNKTVREVFNEIERKSDFVFFYYTSAVDENRKVRIRMENQTIDKILDQLFKNTDNVYTIDERQIYIARRMASPELDPEQLKTKITGTVVDPTGEPLIGANIVEKNVAGNGTVTDAEGNFALSVQENAVLRISYIGYITQDVAVGRQTRLQVTLKEELQSLDEVVAVGYGIQKKVNLTGSVATLNVEELSSVPASNLSNALGGRLSGVFVSGGMGGRPGNSSAIVVRSKGTWNNVDPLYVIDGVVRDKFAFDGIDANDVENISILKDAASTAIYGSRSANGVVLVTTKKGKEGKPVITYNGTVGVSDATRIPATQNAYDHATFINDGLRVGGADASNANWFTDDELAYFKTHSYNWIEEAWRNPMLTQHSLNVNGGNQHVRYFIGGSTYYETGGFDNMDFKKYTLRGNIEANITKNLVATLNLNLDSRDDHKPYWVNDNDRDTMDDTWSSFLLLTSSFYPPYINGLPVRPASFSQTSHIMEVINRGGEVYNNRRYTNHEANIALQYHVPAVKGLSVKALYNLYNRQQFTKKFNIPQTLTVFKTTGEHGHIVTEEPTGATWTRSGDGNLLDERFDRTDSYQFNAFVNYDRTFGDHSVVNAVFIYEQSEGTTDWFKASTKNFINTAIDQFPAGSKNTSDFGVDGNGTENGRLSYAGRIHYGYADKYLLELSARYDGSVKFAPARRWGFFPSASAAWRISEENFFKEHVSFIDYLKLRASVGLLGNDAVAGWQWMAKYSFDSGAEYGSTASGLKPGVLANTEVTWEKSLTYDGGLDFAFLNNRLRAAANVFYKHTYDILGDRLKALPVTFGGKDMMPAENYGVVDSHGYELELGYTDRIDDFIWRVGGNITYATNKYVELDEAENIRAFQSKKGLNLDREWGYVYTDIIRTQADLDALPEGYTIMGETPQLGMLNYKDIRGVTGDEPDGKITAEDQDWIIDRKLPPVSYGFFLGAEWKGFALDLLFHGFAGHDVLYQQRKVSGGTNEKNYDFWTDHWTPENPNAKYPRAESSRYMWGDMPASSFWVKDGSFLRLKNINLSWSLPKSLLSKLNIAEAKALLTATNLFLLEDHIKDFDPELGIDSGISETGNGNITRYPPMRSISLGLNFSF